MCRGRIRTGLLSQRAWIRWNRAAPWPWTGRFRRQVQFHPGGLIPVFKELAPLLRHRAVIFTVPHVEEDQFRVDVIPKKITEGDNEALTTPSVSQALRGSRQGTHANASPFRFPPPRTGEYARTSESADRGQVRKRRFKLGEDSMIRRGRLAPLPISGSCKSHGPLPGSLRLIRRRWYGIT